VAFEGVEVVPDGKSFFWSGRYHLDMNTRDSLITDLNVLAQFDPKIPDSYQDCDYVMLGNLVPSVQIQVIEQLKNKPKLVIMDTMNFWMDIAMDKLKEVLKMVDLLMVNDGEARQLSGEYSLVKAAKKIQEMGPKYVIIKKGEHGSILSGPKGLFVAPAYPLKKVVDPTGAGDSFVGGLMGYLAAQKSGSVESHLRRAIIHGSVVASFCCEGFGLNRTTKTTKAEITARVRELEKCSKI
jgi:sugar/nucleoside kinase (ribokinase family)